MRYIKLKASFRYAPDRLFRVLLVPENVDLLRLAQIIGDSFHVEWEHLFEFRKGDTHYVLTTEDDFGDFFSNSISEPMQDHDIRDLGQKAVFEYDFGDGWLFDLRFYKRIVEWEEEKAAFVLEGAGQGVWEDNIGGLFAYFDGSVTDDAEPNDFEYNLPWNFNNENYSDFDKPLDFIAEQKYLEDRLKHKIVLEDDEAVDEDDDSIMEEFLKETDGLDRLGTDKALHKWVSQAMTKLCRQYGEPRATMLVFRMLLEEQQSIAEGFEDDATF